MRRLSLVVLALGVLVVWTAPAAVAQSGDEITLPPVRLKTDAPPPAPAPTPTVAPLPPAPLPPAPPTVPPAPVYAPPAPVVAPSATVTAPPSAMSGERTTPLKAPEVQKEATEAQVAPTADTKAASAGEIGLVDEVAKTRKAYQKALLALKDFYVARGNAVKTDWVDSELAAFAKVPNIQYLGVAELAGPNLRPLRRIDAADQLFKEGISFKDYPAFPPGKKDYLKTALEKFQTIIEKYPESDKIDEAAFRMGEIYGGWYFEDWARAVECYQRCWQWNPNTLLPAMLNAAKIYDEKLKDRAKAIELYNSVIAKSQDSEQVKIAQERLRALTGK